LPWPITTATGKATEQTISIMIVTTTAITTNLATNVAKDSKIEPQTRFARELQLSVNFDKTQAKVGEEITCQVHAERIGHRGYGMMLAKIGLPP
jgi:hypothetical protein